MTRYIIFSQVKRVFEKKPYGWFVHLDGSHESLCLGEEERPDLKDGDCVKISIERVPEEDAKP